MKKIVFGILSIVCLTMISVFNSGCSKDCDPTLIHDSTTINHFDTVTNTSWVMNYFEGSAGNNTYYAPQSFIKGGTAKFASNLYHASQWFSAYDLLLPKEINVNLDSDSLKLVAKIRNVNGDGTANEIDLGLIYSYSSTTLMAGATWQKGANATFCILGVTGQTTNNISEQLTDPSTYAEYGISAQGSQVTSYKNGTALKTVNYTGTTGKLLAVRIAFRGYGEIDQVKLYSGSKLIMIEDFNVDGTTTALWSKP